MLAWTPKQRAAATRRRPHPRPPLCRINKYFAISAKTVTKALKPELETKAARRYITEVKVQQIKNGETVKVTDLTSGKDLTL